MAKQSFSVGQVLTANQMLSLQQTAMLGGSATAKTASYTLVAADAGTVVSVNSTSATTITVNTGLFSAGDTVTIQNWGSGAVTITAGTATVNTAGSLIVPQYDGGVLYFTSASAAIYFDWVQAGATSPLTTKGDIWGYSTSDARIPIGANDTVLTADSTQSLGLKWAAVAAGGMTSIASGSLSGSSVALTSIVGTYKDLKLYVNDVNCSTNGVNVRITVNSLADYDRVLINSDTTSTVFDAAYGTSVYQFQASPYKNGDYNNVFNIIFHDYADTNANKLISSYSSHFNVADKKELDIGLGAAKTTSAITTITIAVTSGTFTGSYNLFGVK